MDKTIASRLKTIDPSLETEKQKAISYGLYAIGLIFAMVLFPATTGYAATAAANTSEKSTPTTKAAVVQQAAATVVKASSRVSQALVGKQGTRTLPSGETVSLTTDTNAGASEEKAVAESSKAVPSQMTSEDQVAAKGLSASPKKYVFKYPDLPVLTEEMQPVKKTLTGEVGFVIKTGMNVEFDRKASSSSDLWIEFTNGIKLEGVKTLKEFLPGDKVQVSYEEAKDHSKRAVRSIKLLKRKTDEEKKREAEADARVEAAAAKKSTLAEES